MEKNWKWSGLSLLHRVSGTTFTLLINIVKYYIFTFLNFSETSGKQSYDHPQFSKIMDSLEEYNEIKYSAYRIAFKIFALQRHLQGKLQNCIP